MGNVLESDSSTDPDESIVVDERTEGDGMESDAIESATPKSLKHSNLEQMNLTPITPGQTPGFSGNVPATLIHTVETAKRLDRQGKASPKQLPPKDKLIGVKAPSKLPTDTSNLNSSFKPPGSKSREPKFVPYEPYRGATRSMTEEPAPSSTHSRKVSSSTVGSTASASYDIESVPQPGATATAVNESKPLTRSLSEFQQCSEHGHSMLLLKERLRHSEKDIDELRKENSRLKKMLVDSMANFGSSSPSDPSNENGANCNNGSESLDNLASEVEVWRSKFLSSCVLVDQLSKQNHNWKDKVTSAADLFRETKQNTEVVLTPQLFHKINAWLHQDNVSSPSYQHHQASLSLYDQQDSISSVHGGGGNPSANSSSLVGGGPLQ